MTDTRSLPDRRHRLPTCRGALAVCLALMCAGSQIQAAPALDPATRLPAGADLDADAVENPREVFHSEVTEGRRSYLSSLGNLAFNSPSILGEAAQRAHISCGTCHVNGASNPKLFIPGLSTHPGTFDTTNALFDPKDDNQVLDAVTIPSLRGVRQVAPYGHAGRFATLEDFVRHAIVSEFAGPQPPAPIMEALVAYLEDIDFLSNSALRDDGSLSDAADAAARRGEGLFHRPFPRNARQSCATCHVPAAAFVDHLTHDVGSGGTYKTPTLLNADFAGRYFHDGRYESYAQVVAHFDRFFDLSLTPADQADLVAYLSAVGGGARPSYHLTGTNVLDDCTHFASVLDVAIPQHDVRIVALAVQTVSEQLQGLAEHYPADTGGRPAAGSAERALARAAVQALRDALQHVEAEMAAGRPDAAAAAWAHYQRLSSGLAPAALAAAERWSLFAPAGRARPVEPTPGTGSPANARPPGG